MIDTPEDLEIIISAEVQAEMDKDPELAAAMRSMFASLRQAHQSVETGQYDNLSDAIEAITGNRLEAGKLGLTELMVPKTAAGQITIREAEFVDFEPDDDDDLEKS